MLVALLFSQRGTSATAEQTVTAINPIIEFDPDDFMEQGFNFNHALILVCNKRYCLITFDALLQFIFKSTILFSV